MSEDKINHIKKSDKNLEIYKLTYFSFKPVYEDLTTFLLFVLVK